MSNIVRLKTSGLLFSIAVLGLFLGKGIMKQGDTAEELIRKVRAKLDKVNDYEAKGKMKTNVVFIKAPVATVKVYFKKPNRIRINNETGISFIPKGSVNINLSSIFVNGEGYDIIDMGKEAATGLRMIKLLPKEENSDVVLSTIYVDEANALIKKAKTTTRENGTYELEMSYGKYMEYGLADKIIFSFNTKNYKLPRGVTLDYDDGTRKDDAADKLKNRKGKVEIVYTSYSINKGVSDAVFQ
jgi:outer membrane lipoprotein-sorting protein